MRGKDFELKSGEKYIYTTSDYTVQNVLGIDKATLKEFKIYGSGNTQDIICTLYQTQEGNWYDLEHISSINPLLITHIKMAIDKSETPVVAN